MRVRSRRSRWATVLSEWWLPTLAVVAYVATLAMHGQPSRGAEPTYMLGLGVVALAALIQAAVVSRFSSIAGPVLLITGLVLHSVALVGLAPERSDLAFLVAVVAVATMTLEGMWPTALALLFAGLHLGPAWLQGELTEDVLIFTLLPLAAAVAPVGLIAAGLRRRRRRAETELRRWKSLIDHVEELEAGEASRLSEAGVQLRRAEAARRLDDELGLMLALMKRSLGATRIILFDLQLRTETLVPRRFECESEAGWSEHCEIVLGKGPVGWAALKGVTYATPEGRTESADPGYVGEGRKPGSLVAVPIKRGEIVSGVLVADHFDPGAFAAGDRALLEDFAGWMTALLDSTGVLRHQEEEAEKFRSLHDASQRLARSLALEELVSEVLQLVKKQAGFDRAYVVSRLPEGGFRVLASDGDGAAESGTTVGDDVQSWGGHLCKQERGFILDLAGERGPMPLVGPGEGKASFQGVMGIPFQMKGETSGGILVGSRDRSYRARDQQLLEILANQAAHALENAQLYQRMEEMATTDGLTGLYNHRYFQEALDRELDRAERQKSRLSLALLDIDHFKSFNDTYGHPAGDEVLRILAGVLLKTARKTDIVARYGGEEFVVILPDTDAKRAGEMATRIRNAVRKKAFRIEGKSLRVTVSIGIACYPDDAVKKGELIDAADKALYHSKEGGRDQWTAYRKIAKKQATG